MPDADADDDELGRVRRLHADLDVQAAERPLGGRIQRLVDADVERVLLPSRRTARRRASAPGTR